MQSNVMNTSHISAQVRLTTERSPHLPEFVIHDIMQKRLQRYLLKYKGKFKCKESLENNMQQQNNTCPA